MPFPIPQEEIAKTENKVERVFPPAFKAHMQKENGGEIEVAEDDWNLIPFLDTSEKKRLSRTCNDIIRETETMRQWDAFPKEAFAIAQNGAGDWLILLPEASGSKQLAETIYFWDHETGRYQPVADSIESVLHL